MQVHMFENWFRWSGCRCCAWERGDLQWQSSWGGALTVWASEVSLQQQALKQNHNWLEQPRGIVTRMTLLLREIRPSQTHCKPSGGVVYNRSKSFILSFSGSAKTLQDFAEFPPQTVSGSLSNAPVFVTETELCKTYLFLLLYWLDTFIYGCFSLPTKSFYWGWSPSPWVSNVSRVSGIWEETQTQTHKDQDWEFNSILWDDTEPPPPLDYKIRLRKYS